jgi:C-terminal processing protease CtpA/Prc
MLLALSTVAAAAPLGAQSDTVVVRRVSTWQRDLEQLTQQLVSDRRAEAVYTRQLGELEARLVSARSDSLKKRFQAQSQFVLTQLREVSANRVRLQRIIESKCSDVQKPEGYLGVATTGYTVYDRVGDGPQLVRYMEPPVVESVDPGSPADRVGLRSGDVLIEIGGRQLMHRDIVFAELLRPGQKIEIKLMRGGRELTLEPLVAPAPESLNRTPCSWVDANTAYVIAPSAEMQGMVVRAAPGVRAGAVIRLDSSRVNTVANGSGSFGYAGPMVNLFNRGANPVAGVQLLAVTDELSKALDRERGLLVLQVLPGTLGHEAGLRVGDVLVEADSQELRTSATLQRVFSRSDDRTVTLVLIRDKKRQTVTLKW